MESIYLHNREFVNFNRGLSLSRSEAIPEWLLYIFIATVFSKEIGTVFLFGVEYDTIGYTFSMLYFIYYLNRLYINGYIIVFAMVLLVNSIIAKTYLSLSFAPLFKQWVPITLILIVTFDFISRCGDIKRIFRAYMKISYYTAIIGIVQLLVKFLFGIKLLTDYSSYFIDSVAREPSHYASIILPACICSIMTFKTNKLRNSIIILATLGTFSTTAYAVLMVMVVIIYLNPVYLLLVIPFLYFIYHNVLLGYDKFSDRISSMNLYFSGTNMDNITNGTSLSFITNYETAEFSVKESPLIGSGLGGHEEMYHRYFSSSSFRHYYLYGLNSLSGHSLIIRIFSEWGLLGAGFYIFFQIKTLILSSGTFHRVISIACLSHFLCKFLKLGGYFDYGTPFFAILMWMNYQDYRKYIQTKQGEKRNEQMACGL